MQNFSSVALKLREKMTVGRTVKMQNFKELHMEQKFY